MKAPATFGARGVGFRGRGSKPDGNGPVLIVLCGPSHAGKSTFARQHLKGCRIVSTDRIRERLGARFGRCEPEPGVWNAFEAEKGCALREGRSVVLDACHMTERARRHALRGPNGRHRRVCIVFNPPLETVRARCRRDGRLALSEAERMWRAFQRCRPTARRLRREGFDEVRFVRNGRAERPRTARVTARAVSGSAARGGRGRRERGPGWGPGPLPGAVAALAGITACLWLGSLLKAWGRAGMRSRGPQPLRQPSPRGPRR